MHLYIYIYIYILPYAFRLLRSGGVVFFFSRRSQSVYSRFKIPVVPFSLLQNRNFKGASIAVQFVPKSNAALYI